MRTLKVTVGALLSQLGHVSRSGSAANGWLSSRLQHPHRDMPSGKSPPKLDPPSQILDPRFSLPQASTFFHVMDASEVEDTQL